VANSNVPPRRPVADNSFDGWDALRQRAPDPAMRGAGEDAAAFERDAERRYSPYLPGRPKPVVEMNAIRTSSTPC